MINLIVFWVEAIANSDGMGRMRSTEPRSIGHARAILVRLHQTGINHAWVMNNDRYLFGYIRDEDTGETFYDSCSIPESELSIN